MSPTGEKIITKLSDRRQIDGALRRLLDASSEADLRSQVRAVAARGPQVIPSIVAALEQADAAMLAALGLVASRIDRSAMVDALLRALRKPGSSYRARAAAVTLLERHLGVEVADDLRPRLAETRQAAVSALGDILDRAERDPYLLVGAVHDYDQMEPDVVLAVVAALRAVPGVRPVALLRMLAQDVRGDIASEAIQALGSLRFPQAAWALQTLIPPAGPALRPAAERLLRKLQFAGMEVEPLPLPSSDWRALVGAVDGEGQRQLWFVEEQPGPTARRLLILSVGDTAGVVDAVEYREVHKLSLPRRQPPGTWPLTRLGSVEMNSVEAPFDVGRRLVAGALERNRETQVPLPGTLRLLGDWLWGTRVTAFPPMPLLEQAAGDEALIAESGRLAEHPAFVDWHPALRAARAAAEDAFRRPGWDREVWVRRLAAGLVSDPAAARLFAGRLEANAEWLALAGQALPARMARQAAAAILGEHALRLPFLLALVRRDLDAAMGESPGSLQGPDRQKGEV